MDIHVTTGQEEFHFASMVGSISKWPPQWLYLILGNIDWDLNLTLCYNRVHTCTEGSQWVQCTHDP